jgi:hypothetical protein
MSDRGIRVRWEFRDHKSGHVQVKHRDFKSLEAANEFVKRQNATNPWMPERRIYELSESTQEQFKYAKREEVAALNRQRMVHLMLKYGITIHAREFDKWRPTEEISGRIAGIEDGLTCIMTNGLLGYFVRQDESVEVGHVDWFIWDTSGVNDDGELTKKGAPPTYHRADNSAGKVKKPRKPRAVITTGQALAQVNKLLAKHGIKPQ